MPHPRLFPVCAPRPQMLCSHLFLLRGLRSRSRLIPVSFLCVPFGHKCFAPASSPACALCRIRLRFPLPCVCAFIVVAALLFPACAVLLQMLYSPSHTPMLSPTSRLLVLHIPTAVFSSSDNHYAPRAPLGYALSARSVRKVQKW